MPMLYNELRACRDAHGVGIFPKANRLAMSSFVNQSTSHCVPNFLDNKILLTKYVSLGDLRVYVCAFAVGIRLLTKKNVNPVKETLQL